jgi:hypothetical protein
VDGRPNAAIEDLGACLLPALRHRVALNYEGLGAGMAPDALVAEAWAAAMGSKDRVEALLSERGRRR